ncbi:hypothetical protein IKE97_02875, partial [Candidatus Saccharibacteria bacterium]|nr:hypothetical protein [Candidatus Saccharibacteria bacterium]
RTNVTLYYPSSTSARTSKTLYRNQYVNGTSGGNMSTTVLSDSNTGTTDYAPSTPITGYSIAGYAASASTNTVGYAAVSNMAADAGTTYYMILSKSVTATFYYNNNTSDSPTSYTAAVTSTTASGTQYVRCTSSAAEISNGSISVPAAVSNSKGTHGENYLNVGTSTSNMTAVSPTTGSTTYYARYSDAITIYKPASETTTTSATWHRNQRVTGTAAANMSTAVLNTADTGTSNSSYSSSVSNYSLYGFATSTNTATVTYGGTTPVQTAAEANAVYSTLYAIETRSVTATFYYNNNTTSGTCNTTSIKSTTASGTRTLYTTSTTAATTSQGSISVPSAVSGSAGTYCNAYAGVATSTGSMSAATPNTGTTTYYAFYRSNVTLYYPSSTSARTSKTLYRNQTFASTSALNTTVLSDSQTGTSNYAPSTPVTGYSIVGYAASASTNTASFASVSAMATDASCGTTYYMILNATYYARFCYNNNTTPTSGTSSVTSAAKSATRYVRVTSSAAEISNSNYSPPTGHYGTYNNALAGWATSTGTMTTTTPATSVGATSDPGSGTCNFYAVYRTNVTNYYYSGSAYTSRTLYRNQTLSSTSAMGTTYLSTSTTGLSNYTTAPGPGSSATYGFSTSLGSTTRTYSSVSGAAESTATTLNTIYRFLQEYSKYGSTGVSSIGYYSSMCFVSSTSATAGGTSCTVTTPSITVDTGYTSLGWGTQGHTTNGTAAGTDITLSTSDGTLYANAKINTYTVTLNRNCSTTATGSTSATATYNSTTLSAITVPTCANYTGTRTLSGFTTSSNNASGATVTYSTSGSSDVTWVKGSSNNVDLEYCTAGAARTFTLISVKIDGTVISVTEPSGCKFRISASTLNNYDIGVHTILATKENDDTGNISTNSFSLEIVDTAGGGNCTSASNCKSTSTTTYAFNGWHINSGTGTLVASTASTPALQPSVSGYTDSSSRWTRTSAATIYAGWDTNTSSFNSVTLPTITKSGYICGWTTTSSGATSITYNSGYSFVPSDNMTLYGVCFSNSSTMQAMSNSDCTTTAKTVRDIRDGRQYKVRRLADNKCWMLDNLSLSPINDELNELDGKTNASKTTLTYFLNGGGSSPYPATGVDDIWTSSSYNKYNQPKVKASYRDTTITSYGAGSGKIGVYYNFCAASAGSYCYSSSAGTGNATEDLCPAGWRLPTSGDSGEYRALCTAYKGSTCTSTSSNSMTATSSSSLQYNLSTPLSGRFNSGSQASTDTAGVFWSSTFSSSTNMNMLYVVSGNVTPSYTSGGRHYGYSIRCVKK